MTTLIAYLIIGAAVGLYETILQVRLEEDRYRTCWLPLFFVIVLWPVWIMVIFIEFLGSLAPLEKFDKFLIYLFKKREP